MALTTGARQEQLSARLTELVDLYLVESDPRSWPSSETKDGRGDRYWMKRNAEATALLAMRARALLDLEIVGATLSPDERDRHDASIAEEGERLSREAMAKLEAHEARRGRGPKAEAPGLRTAA